MKNPLRTKYRVVSQNGVFIQSCIALFPIWFYIMNDRTGKRYNFGTPNKAMSYIKGKLKKSKSSPKVLYQTK